MVIFSPQSRKTPSASLALIQFLLSPSLTHILSFPLRCFPRYNTSSLRPQFISYLSLLFFPSIAITAAAFVFLFSVLIILSLSIPVFPFCAPHCFRYIIYMLALPSPLGCSFSSNLPQFLSNIDESSFHRTCC
ncbi:hypothetical protein B9Z19DRAFT_714793 [Tuber borchii]|uniref:Uncharacterized protein n=1 Tax=Tuber borchii TaxID=42251 RepID=A0A2T6ZYV1_TUBBO|nr:hypothetical protein B9Z19DRAFT_714793 [Tuber borchii]